MNKVSHSDNVRAILWGLKSSRMVLRANNLELLLEITSPFLILKLIIGSGINYTNWNILTTKVFSQLELCLLRPKTKKCSQLSRRTEKLILKKFKDIEYFLFFWSRRCLKVELYIKNKNCLKMRYIKGLLKMTSMKGIQSINLKKFESASRVKRQVFAFFAIFATKNAFRGTKCNNWFSEKVARVRNINWHLDGTNATPSFWERNSLPGAFRLIKTFHNIGPKRLQCD